MNQCLRQFGMGLLARYYEMLTKNRFRTVSVPSGNGVVEHAIQNPSRPIICIDPDPDSFQRTEEGLTDRIEPHYSYCKDLVKAQPDIVGNCNLFLNWPEGDEHGRYDVESIVLLRPLRILLIIESTGGGGSDLFYEFVKQRVYGFELVERDYGWVKEYRGKFNWSMVPRYYVVRSDVIRYETGGSYCSRNFRMMLLSTTKPRTPPIQICNIQTLLKY